VERIEKARDAGEDGEAKKKLIIALEKEKEGC